MQQHVYKKAARGWKVVPESEAQSGQNTPGYLLSVDHLKGRNILPLVSDLLAQYSILWRFVQVSLTGYCPRDLPHPRIQRHRDQELLRDEATDDSKEKRMTCVHG